VKFSLQSFLFDLFTEKKKSIQKVSKKKRNKEK